ncbi:uncharacterized protein LOC135121562 [Zophobas morio]|uniref:uncharacterized protein LOC135121562 n=1 Tax=Zophobas morio TaxID=2755281 RepID=UPI00308342E8
MTRLDQVERMIVKYPDFPSKGILFLDIFPLFKSPSAIKALLEEFQRHITPLLKVDTIVGLEARGLLFGPTLALKLGCAFVPVRKAGKLPGHTVSVEYKKEYGIDKLEIHAESISFGDNVVIIDDVLATGGTMKAAVDLVKKLGGNVIKCLVLIEITELKGKDIVGAPCYALFEN